MRGLIPCPLCNGEAGLSHYTDCYSAPYIKIRCQKCGLSLITDVDVRDSDAINEARAIEKWNRRDYNGNQGESEGNPPNWIYVVAKEEADDRKNLKVEEKIVTSDNYILLRLFADTTVGYRAEFFHFYSMRKLTLCINRDVYNRILAYATETKDGVVPFYEVTIKQKREQWEWGVGTKIEFVAISKKKEVPVPVEKGLDEDGYILTVFKHAFPEKAKKIELERNWSSYMCMLANGMMPRMEVL